ncbi:hypothetical protein Ga0466249_003940 [Sporomusaceae bacterium BoRhaA]|nr:hypothetical protein [Pelorhabdus rhamnosifermentans]
MIRSRGAKLDLFVSLTSFGEKISFVLRYGAILLVATEFNSLIHIKWIKAIFVIPENNQN